MNLKRENIAWKKMNSITKFFTVENVVFMSKFVSVISLLEDDDLNVGEAFW